MAPKTLLLVFIHGFKGSDHTFAHFPADLRALLAHTLPKLDVVSLTYPRYETRGDLKECVGRFREWLENKVIDLEVANRTPSPTVEPSVHVVLCGHSMGGIVAAETLLSIAGEEVVGQLGGDGQAFNSTSGGNSTTRAEESHGNKPVNLDVHDDKAAEEQEHQENTSTSSPPPLDSTRLLFPRVKAIIAFDTPYLGISPGVLAHGAEEHINHASSAYKAFDSASSFFGWGSPRSGSPAQQPIPDAANKALPAADGSTASTWNKWSKYAAFGGAAAALAGAAGAAYLSRNQISQGFAWAGSHFEFVSSLARGAELQKRVERVVQLTQSHGVGFADFYTALGGKASGQTTNFTAAAGERTFCVVPKSATQPSRLTSGSQADRSASPAGKEPPLKSRKTAHRVPDPSGAGLDEEMSQADEVQRFAQDGTKSKGHWVKCVNEAVGDEIAAHTAMFTPKSNPGYHSMLPAARDEIVQWVDWEWYESSSGKEKGVGLDGGEEDIEEADDL